MATLAREGDELVLTLTAAEKLESLHGDIRLPMSAVRDVVVVDDVLHAIHGLKSVGAAWSGEFYIGTFHGDSGKTFAAVHHGTPRGVRVTLGEANFDHLVVGCEDPEEVASQLGGPTAPPALWP